MMARSNGRARASSMEDPTCPHLAAAGFFITPALALALPLAGLRPGEDFAGEAVGVRALAGDVRASAGDVAHFLGEAAAFAPAGFFITAGSSSSSSSAS
eukprot:CAMPEP_0204223264 /NCGR_PEP_ID=MMETSP0361-20130328/82699_1 /ASSEMBLY_ACC=CAM_ASM_000343 /TAXON_ID=268821 /ORGANISM="Scrippsiella Hangoei, Strain SHTV-5" /LENGTH=98 /DNA_ID=CAMNT_0051188959 /DNA_START=104 /DNA_END=397 /DNA_ORIENTATION=-